MKKGRATTAAGPVRGVRAIGRETAASPFALWIGGAWPPSADKRLVQMRNGMRLRTEDYKDFLALIARSWKALGEPGFGDAWLKCYLHFIRPDNRRRDSHNTIKALLDALQEAGAFEDDLSVMPSVESVRGMDDVIFHPLIPKAETRGGMVGPFPLEPGVLVLLQPAGRATFPGS